MDLVKVRGYGFETAADRRKGAAAVVACGLKEKRLPHQVRQSLFPPPHTAAAPPHSRNPTVVRTSCRGSVSLRSERQGRAAEHRGNCRTGDRGQRLRYRTRSCGRRSANRSGQSSSGCTATAQLRMSARDGRANGNSLKIAPLFRSTAAISAKSCANCPNIKSDF